MSIADLRDRLQQLSNRDTATILQRFFKTGPGEYGEGDLFLGIKVPPLRLLAKEFIELSAEHTLELLHSKYHEERVLALMILTAKFARANEDQQQEIYQLYIDNMDWINNWDLVDGSAPYIVGPYLYNRSRQQLYDLAPSDNLWRRRIAIIATFYFIRKKDFADSLNISEMLLQDKEDLIHKAVGWMLREIGKRDLATEEQFLQKHYKKMPRTMLRYAIEKFSEEKRRYYMAK